MKEKFKKREGSTLVKKNTGITMIQMVITIVMLVLIAGFSIYNSSDTIAETKAATAYQEITEVKKAVMEYVVLHEDKEDLQLFRLDSLSGFPTIASFYTDEENQEFYYLNYKADATLLNEILETRNVTSNYIVNVKDLNNVEIFLTGGIKMGNQICYTDKQILEKYNDIFSGR